MVNWQSANGLGFNSYTRNILLAPFGHATYHGSTYNNGFGRLRFNVNSYLPGNGPFSTYQRVKEFDNMQFLPVLYALGRAGVTDLPRLSLAEFLYNPNRFMVPPDFADAWGRYFSVPRPYRHTLGYAA